MDLFRDAKKGKFGKKVKREAAHELEELGGEERAKKFEKKVKDSKKEALEKKRKGSRE